MWDLVVVRGKQDRATRGILEEGCHLGRGRGVVRVEVGLELLPALVPAGNSAVDSPGLPGSGEVHPFVLALGAVNLPDLPVVESHEHEAPLVGQGVVPEDSEVVRLDLCARGVLEYPPCPACLTYPPTVLIEVDEYVVLVVAVLDRPDNRPEDNIVHPRADRVQPVVTTGNGVVP